MKYYEYGFTESGEFFAVTEYAAGGRTLYCTAENAEEATEKFESYLDGDYITEYSAVREMTNNEKGMMEDDPNRFLCIDCPE